MSFDHIESPALKEFNSHCQGLLDFSTEHKDEAESDSALGNGSDRKTSPSLRGANSAASVASDSADIRIPDLSDSYTHVSAATPALSRETPKTAKAKTIRDLDCEECLRRIHSLSAGDNVYFRRGVLGMGLDAEPTKPGDYVEGRVICFSFDKLKRYVIVTLEGYGFLKFTFGDLYRMSVDKNVCLQRLQNPGSVAKSVKQKRQRLDYEDEYLMRRSCKGQLVTGADESDYSHIQEDSCPQYTSAAPSAKVQCTTEAGEVRTRPIPTGVETFCKCRFINKVEFVRKLRGIISQNKQDFFEKTSAMQELRLIMTQNVRAYELEMVAYLLEEDPWSHSANPQERPSEEGVQEIINQYKAAVSNNEYVTLFAQWQKYQKALKNEAKAATSAQVAKATT
ncbi:hypothetical protein X943_003900 [Babesia divergens]|uniref:Uncharacterized protein n=1 Tax=Babesia divergens TaxID=32595 RepID=A0AAD9LKQ6_BABDI|nr:hypothetical protein X943_003900 [Babesia divergens]